MADGLDSDIDSIFGAIEPDEEVSSSEPTEGDLDADIDSIFGAEEEPGLLERASQVVDTAIEKIDDNDYKDLGLIESLGYGAVSGAANTARLTGQTIGKVGEYAMDPSQIGKDVGAVGEGIANAWEQDPGAVIKGGARVAGGISSSIAGAGYGAAIGSAFPVVGTVAGGVAGAILGPTAFEGALQAVETVFDWFGVENDIQEKTPSQVFGEIGENIGGAGFGYTAGKGLKALGAGFRAANQGVLNMQAQRATKKELAKNAEYMFAKYGNDLPSDLEETMRRATPHMTTRGIALRETTLPNGKSALPRVREGEVFKAFDTVINHEVGAQDVSLIKRAGRRVHDSLRNVGKDFGLNDVDDTFNLARRAEAGTQVKEKFAGMQEEARRGFITRAARKLYEEGDTTLTDDYVDSIVEKRKQLIQAKKDVESAKKRPRRMPPKKGKSLAQLTAERDGLIAELADFDKKIADVKLDAVEFWKATKDGIRNAGGVNFDADKFPLGKKVLIRLRKETQNLFERVLDPDGIGTKEALEFRNANLDFHSIADVADIAKKAINAETKLMRDGRLPFNPAKLLKKVGPLLGAKGDQPTPPIKHFQAWNRAWDGAESAKESRFLKFMETGTLRAEEMADSFSDFFTPKYGALYGRTLLAAEEFMEMFPEETESERELSTGMMEAFYESAAKVADAIEEGQGQPPEVQAKLYRPLAVNPNTAAWIKQDRQEGLTEGVYALNRKPMDAVDRDRFFSNLSNSDLDNYEKARIRREYNKTGLIPKTLEPEEVIEIDEPELQKQIQMEKARESIRPIKNSKDVVKASKMSFEEDSLFQPTSFGELDMSDFEEAFNLVLGSEGGFSDDPRDRGGRTNYGVTQKTYNSWRERNNLNSRDISKINEEEVREIYQEFWKDASADELPWPLSAIVFDAAINSGPATAKKQLQEILGVRRDGVIGPETLGALEDTNIATVTEDFLDKREEFYKGLNQPEFLKGWRNRVKKMRRFARSSGSSGIKIA